ncbi:hypothetical protein BDF20DRAFT_873744 [Mycotypha africana]|uniref:uncharacterized protein n=1 Tax=Mycotypha africana TaxID=64632 RepID=UPI002300157B|nr:uncharacterized protein BDF20DRAFT_873744 [Mycotypha africana]KAI8977245.1 hypothetical protein BDF20DRAFT_873744 [Mycotypha africana]
MVDAMGSSAFYFADPGIESTLLSFFCLISIILLSLLIWIILLCIKIDRTVHWSWTIVFLPMWLIDSVVLWATIYRIRHYNSNTSTEQQHRWKLSDENDQSMMDNNNTDEDEEEGTTLLGSHRRRKQWKLRDKQQMIQRFRNQYLPCVNTCLFIAFQLFIVLQLDTYTRWSPWTLFLPYYVYELLSAILHFFSNAKGTSKRFKLACILQLTCIMLQLTHRHSYNTTAVSWAIVFIPTYCLGLYYTFLVWKQYKRFVIYVGSGNRQIRRYLQG